MATQKGDTLSKTQEALEKALTQSSVSNPVTKKKSRVVAPQHTYQEVARKNTSGWNENSSHKKPR